MKMIEIVGDLWDWHRRGMIVAITTGGAMAGAAVGLQHGLHVERPRRGWSGEDGTCGRARRAAHAV